MDADLNLRLDYELLMLRSKRGEYASRLEQIGSYEGVRLKRTKHDGSDYYYSIKRPGDSTYKYAGRQSRSEVSLICESRFLTEAVRRIDSNIDLIDALKEGYFSLDIASINNSLPHAYRCESLPLAESYKVFSSMWLARNLDFQKKFPENYPQYKKHRTSDGVMVKTISEVVLYERFKAAGLTQIYELPFVPEDYGPALYPDFTILSPLDMETSIFVEFVGRMDLQKYREDFARKTGRYIENGYIPGINLFFIFNDRDGNIDSLQITKVIADILGLRYYQTH